MNVYSVLQCKINSIQAERLSPGESHAMWLSDSPTRYENIGGKVEVPSPPAYC